MASTVISRTASGVDVGRVEIPMSPIPLPTGPGELVLPPSPAQSNHTAGSLQPSSSSSTKWTACNQSCSRAFFQFLAQFAISLSVILLCIIKLAMGGEEDKSVYVGLLCTILGVWMPQPSLKAPTPKSNV